MTTTIEAAAGAMLEYERWLRVRESGSTGNGDRYEGVTADDICDAAAGGDIHAWAVLAGAAIERAVELRGCSATAARVRGQRERSQATGRRTIPKKIARAA
jgi:hypothetical protein